jgi:hypothetical protein
MQRMAPSPRVGLTAVAVVAAAVLACGGGTAALAATPTLDASHLPRLPAEGLIVPQGGGLLLMGLDGHVYGRLAGYLTYPGPGASSGRRFVEGVAIQALESADPTLAIVFDHLGRPWLLDAASSRLVPLAAPTVALAGNATLRIAVSGSASRGVGTKAIVERAGRTLLSGSVTVVGTRYAATAQFDSQAPGVLLDLRTGERWRLLPGCAVAGVLGGRAIAACAPPGANSAGRLPYRLYSFAPDGARRTLATFTPGLFVNSASLSPDARWLLVYTSPGCGPGWSAVFPASGGTGRMVTGEGVVPTRGALPASRYSYGIGWTGDDRIVSDINAPTGSSCDRQVSSGTFLIDPATLSRVHVSSLQAALMWGSAPGG